MKNKIKDTTVEKVLDPEDDSSSDSDSDSDDDKTKNSTSDDSDDDEPAVTKPMVLPPPMETSTYNIDGEIYGMKQKFVNIMRRMMKLENLINTQSTGATGTAVGAPSVVPTVPVAPVSVADPVVSPVDSLVQEYPSPDIRGPMPQNAHPDSTFSSHVHNDWTYSMSTE